MITITNSTISNIVNSVVVMPLLSLWPSRLGLRNTWKGTWPYQLYQLPINTLWKAILPVVVHQLWQWWKGQVCSMDLVYKTQTITVNYWKMVALVTIFHWKKQITSILYTFSDQETVHIHLSHPLLCFLSRYSSMIPRLVSEYLIS